MPTKERLKEFLSFKKMGRNKFEDAIGIASGYMSSKGISINSDVIEKTSVLFPDLNMEWLITGKGEMIKSGAQKEIIINLPEKETNEETRPRIPYNAAAGSVTHAVDGISINDVEQIPVVRAFSHYDYSIFVRGESMANELYSGDEIFCKAINNSKFVKWGDIHVLDTYQGVVVKRIYDDGDAILCVSENSEKYKDFRIPKEEIYNIGLVVGMIRRY